MLLLVGAGHTHVEVLRRRIEDALPSANVTLITPSREWVYSGMLPGVIAGHYKLPEASVDVAALAERAGVAFVATQVVGLDLAARTARLANGRQIAFDVLSLDIGSTPAELTGHHPDAVAVKPFDRFARAFSRCHEGHDRGTLGTIAVVGAGAGAIEIALAMRRALAAGGDTASVAVVGDEIKLSPRGSRRALEALARRGIHVELGSAVARLDQAGLVLASGRLIPAEHVVLATHASPAPWLRASGLACDEAGFVLTDSTLRSISHDFVFASGDCGSVIDAHLPKAGVVAVRQAPVLAANLAAVGTGARLRRFRPQRHWLALIGTGDACAIAIRGAFAADGPMWWRWKQRIDRAFVRRYATAVRG